MHARTAAGRSRVSGAMPAASAAMPSAVARIEGRAMPGRIMLLVPRATRAGPLLIIVRHCPDLTAGRGPVLCGSLLRPGEERYEHVPRPSRRWNRIGRRKAVPAREVARKVAA